MISEGEVHTMEAPANANPGWLSREQIDSVIEQMSTADLVAGMSLFDPKSQPTQMAIAAFDHAAQRASMSNGSPASEHVKMSDFKYLAGKISGAVDIENPLSEGQEG